MKYVFKTEARKLIQQGFFFLNFSTGIFVCTKIRSEKYVINNKCANYLRTVLNI